MTAKEISRAIISYIKKEGRLDWFYEAEIINKIGAENQELFGKVLDKLEEQNKIEVDRVGFIRFFRLKGSDTTRFQRIINRTICDAPTDKESLYNLCINKGYDKDISLFEEEVLAPMIDDKYIHCDEDVYKRGVKKKRRGK